MNIDTWQEEWVGGQWSDGENILKIEYQILNIKYSINIDTWQEEVSWWPVVRRWELRCGKRLKCSALIFENKHSHSPALEHAAGTSTQIIWDIWIFEIFQTKNSKK